jgi:mannose-6-phosphate isomerase-like protein (cupin superfamily)
VSYLWKIKRLHVNPKAKLSLQIHQYRAEQWVVVSGVATVTNGEKTTTLTAGQSTYIPIKTKHSIANLTDIALEIIEVQSGSYLGEDDIIRFKDVYGRETQ